MMGALPRERGHWRVKMKSRILRSEKVQTTTASFPFEEALIVLLPRCFLSLHRRGAGFAVVG